MSATDGKLVFPLLVDKPEKGKNEVGVFSLWLDAFLSILDGKVDLDGEKLDRWVCDQLYRSLCQHPRVGVVVNTVFQKRKAAEYDKTNSPRQVDYAKYRKALQDEAKKAGEDCDEKQKDQVEREWEEFAVRQRKGGTEVVNNYNNLVQRTTNLQADIPMKKRAEAVLESLSNTVQAVWTVSLTSAQIKDPDVLIQKLIEMCKTSNGDESAPRRRGI
uniref:Uncharacterized protein n=1 Tax=Chromera velia CCMP2878 TaxID=1169474 RepID=A0A0G4FV23_9ALVE|eukprot:Cvel_18800.t1-p1 / transcript=Cvel_18800.t1 / gene=Cvel_18800 / organism=Chromera_velia_CCMP2878 / gene_product=hypothetical protein / transcript_product=hypothetical protein / location=Cvel_scaffold1579:4254-4898(-) / protein_length=215 / sequence_SO=supercontig / SO=protein_coding / is_pseudo=false